MMQDMLRGERKETPEPEPAAPPEAQPADEKTGGGLGDLFGEMFETGRTMQRDYQKNIESIFDQFVQGMKR